MRYVQSLPAFAALLAASLATNAPSAARDVVADAPPSAEVGAVVRVESHGCSATVIATGPGRTLLLSAAHPWEGPAARAPIRLTAPAPINGPPVTGSRPRLLRLDQRLDLALVELRAGPLPYVCPVADRPSRSSAQLQSVGYDEMRWPALSARATLVADGGPVTFTRERPWHGRSGGALVDVEQGGLVGVVQGYEVGGRGRGMYASWGAIRSFLGPDRSRLEGTRPGRREERFLALPAGGPYSAEQGPFWR